MNENLEPYISQQKAVNINDVDLATKINNSNGTNSRSLLDRLPSTKILLLILIVIFFFIFLAIARNLLLPHTYNPLVIDPSITKTNEVLFAEIESQESALHSSLHRDLGTGKIPISKELSILFRRSDLLHMQNELMKITDEINDYQHSGNQHSQAEINKRIVEIKAVQERIARILSDKTHGGDLDPDWILEP